MTDTSLDIAVQSVGNGDPVVPDAVCAAAVDLARAAAQAVAGQSPVGDHEGVEADDDRIVTHFFSSTDRAYTNWRWAVTVVRAPRSKHVTVDEVVLLPGPGALLAPPWVPWSDRLQAGDLGIGDVLPTAADDPRLVPGYAGVGPHDEIDDVDTFDALVNDMWLGRPRVLSEYGRVEAADRWYDGEHGPHAPIARAADQHCGSCGFLTLVRGSLSRVFGICANEYAPDDGRVVSFDHGCGAHSEALVAQTEPLRTSDDTAPDDEVQAIEAFTVDPVIDAPVLDVPVEHEVSGDVVLEDLRDETAERHQRSRPGRALNDPFGTAALRANVLAAWAASPARFREDANAEEDLVLGGYRDRVLIELAQNAADAASRAGVRGRLRFELSSADAVLRASNTGAPLDAAGVESASTLRASAKRDDLAVGRFGVGFAAVLAVSDEPSMLTNSGSVTWSLARTRADLAPLSDLADEVKRRGNALPVLRLPYASDARPSVDGFDTEVVLPLRDDAAIELVRGLLTDVDAVLLLTLPSLASVEIVIDGTSRELVAEPTADGVIVDGTRWIVHESTGRLDAELLRDRPVEERGRRDFVLTWAVPVDDAGAPVAMPPSVPAVVHAPTPTDEPLTLPALLVAPLPLDPTRRHVAPGALRDALLDHAAAAYADLVRGLPSTPEVLALVPVSVAAGAIDGELRARILPLLRDVPFIATAEAEIRMRPANAVMLDDAGLASDESLGDVLVQVLPELVPPRWARRAPTALTALGVRRIQLGALIDELATVDREPGWWHSLYSALADAGVSTDLLAGLPVPLGSGGVARSARGLLMPGEFGDLTVLGLRTIHPGAAHPLLLRLGAVDAEPRAVLRDDHVRAAVENSYDAEQPADIADAVLALVAAAQLQAGDEPWLAELALPADDGELYVAGELLMPQGKLAALVVDDAPFGTVASALVERWGAAVLEAVGVLDSFAVVRDNDVMSADHDLDLEDEYLDVMRSVLGVDEPVVMSELVGVRDLEFVRDDAWDAALSLLSQPPLRVAVVEQAVVIGAGLQARVPSYTAWWLREHRVVRGRLATSDPLLVGLFDVVGATGDDEFLVAAGALRDLDDADHDEVAARLGDPSRIVTREQVKALYARLEPRDAPALVRAVRGAELVVVAGDDAAVVDLPELLPLLGNYAVVPASLSDATRVADALNVPLASELGGFALVSEGRPENDYVVHDALMVEDVDGVPQRVAWRFVDGELHVDAGALEFGLGRGRAWRDGQWSQRYLATELLRGVVPSSLLLAEADLD